MKEYAGMLAMAALPIYTGSRSSVISPSEPSKPAKKLPILVSELSSQDAMAIPFMAGGSLLGVFLFLTYISQKWLNLILNGYLALTGMGALMYTFTDLQSWLQMPRGRPLLRHALHTRHLDPLTIASFSTSLLLTAINLSSKHAVVSNVIALSFAHTAISIVKIDSFQTASILLMGLFVYDITFVFGSTVMMTVVDGIDAPIMLRIPGEAAMMMLGLGDVFVPGVVLALARRYDASSLRNRYPLFYTCFFAYLSSLIAAMSASAIFHRPQPALLYISPGILLLILVYGFIKSETKLIWSFQSKRGHKTEEDITLNSKRGHKLGENSSDASEESSS